MHVLTQHYDNARTGANLQETELGPATVAPGRFGKLFELAVEGHVYAQPLYVAKGGIPGVKGRNLLYVATMRNKVYAFDADAGGAPVWSRSLGPFAALPDPNIGPGGYSDIANAVGQHEPVLQPASTIRRAVLEGDPLDPPAPHLRQRAVRDDRAVLLGQVPLVVPPVGHPGTHLARGAATLVQANVEWMLIPVTRALRSQRRDELLPRERAARRATRPAWRGTAR